MPSSKKGKQTHNLKFSANRLIQIPMYSFSCLRKLQTHNSNFFLDFSNQCSVLFITKQSCQRKFSIFSMYPFGIVVSQKVLSCRYTKCMWVFVYRKERKRVCSLNWVLQQGLILKKKKKNEVL